MNALPIAVFVCVCGKKYQSADIDGHPAMICCPDCVAVAQKRTAKLRAKSIAEIVEMKRYEGTCDCGQPGWSYFSFGPRKCDACMQREIDFGRIEVNQKYFEGRDSISRALIEKSWIELCPKQFRDFDSRRLSVSELILKEIFSWTEGQGIFLYGKTGGGKTRIMWELMRKLHFAGRQIMAFDSGLRSKIGAWFSESAETGDRMVEKIKKCEILFLDEFSGKIRPGANARFEEELYAIVDYRYANDLPIFATDNRDGRAIENATSDKTIVGSPLVRRLREMCKTYQIN